MHLLQTQGIGLPALGLGTFRMQGKECASAVESALSLGYRHLDTAEMYGNETEVGAAIAASGIRRDELHVTSKVWHDHLTRDGIRQAFDASLERLQLDHIDLYLVHWPARSMKLPEIFETLMKLREQGQARAIGVANFTLPLLRRVVEEIGVPIACNQIEYHALLDQAPVLNYLRSQSIPLVAYCPLAQGRLADRPELAAIARRHGATPAQVALKWLLDQPGVAAIPKAQHRERQAANLAALKLHLDSEDRSIIAALPKNIRCVNPAFAPAWDAPTRTTSRAS
jgi:2,5-diketo-D-gluconate reductase B